MYPSGRWRGYWEQAGWGRQPMRDLMLRFSAGEVEGQGVDMVGPFSFHGTYDSAGVVTLVKKYRRHDVHYQGKYDGEGTVFGEWSISEIWRGPFALTPEGFTAPADTPIVEV